MSFWSTSTGDNAAENASTEFDSGGGFEVIPDKSNVIAEPDQAMWAEDRDGNRYINIRWSVLKPDEVSGRKFFQKLWVDDLDPKATDTTKAMQKRDKALNMLASIDANAGGKLARKGTRPTDDELALALVGKPMGVFLRVWDKEETDAYGNKTKEPGGNWVAAIKPKTVTPFLSKAMPKPNTGGGSAGGSNFGDDLDSDIPF